MAKRTPESQSVEASYLANAPKTYYGSIEDFSEDDLKIDLVITGEVTDKILGDVVSKKFKATHKEVLRLKDKDYVHLMGLVEKYKGNGGLPKTIAAVGGGSIADYGKVLARETGADLLIFTTALSHDGLSSKRSSLRDGNGDKGSFKAKAPNRIIAFKEVIENADPNLTINGWGDHLSKYSSLSDWKFAEKRGEAKVDEKIYGMIHSSLRDFSQNYRHLFDYFINSGNIVNTFGSSRPLSGGEHAISHTLSKHRKNEGDNTYDMDHGKRVAAFGLFMLGLYDMVGEKSEIGWREYKKKMINLNLPTTLQGLKISYMEFLDAVLAAPKIRNRYGLLDYLDNKGLLQEKLIYSGAVKVGLMKPDYPVEVETVLE